MQLQHPRTTAAGSPLSFRLLSEARICLQGGRAHLVPQSRVEFEVADFVAGDTNRRSAATGDRTGLIHSVGYSTPGRRRRRIFCDSAGACRLSASAGEACARRENPIRDGLPLIHVKSAPCRITGSRPNSRGCLILEGSAPPIRAAPSARTGMVRAETTGQYGGETWTIEALQIAR